MIQINTENSKEHWKFVSVQDKVVLDLGCGRWDKVENVDSSWLTTPEYFVSQMAKKVIALDTDPSEIEWFKNKFGANNKYEFILKSIDSSKDILSLFETYKPDCVKCDIESGERFLLELSPDEFSSIKEYYIETHGNNLYNDFINVFKKFQYTIREQIDLIHTNGACKVIFAYK